LGRFFPRDENICVFYMQIWKESENSSLNALTKMFQNRMQCKKFLMVPYNNNL